MFSSLFQLEKKPVTVYSSSDPSAPTLTAEAGSLKALLKACLVTGYGDKASLGWKMAHESDDTLQAAFQSQDPKASQFLLKINNSTTATAKFSAYQTMSDINTGARALAENMEYPLYASQWRLIGHSRSFVILIDALVKGQKIAVPIIFGDLPKETKRVEPLCILWHSRKSLKTLGGLQSTLFAKPNGNTATYNYPGANYADCYPFVVNAGTGGTNLTKNHGKFKFDDQATAAVLFEPVVSVLPDSTWTFLPMLHPLSTPLSDVANLGQINSTAILAKTGNTNAGMENNDCAVPTDWWWA